MRKSVLTRLAVFVLPACLSWPLAAVTVGVGVAADESSWQLRRSALYCGLWQEVPDFGVVRFWHQAGGDLQLGVQAVDPEAWAGSAELVVSGPAWRPQVPRTLGDLEERRANPKLARSALSALDDGLALRVVVDDGSRVRHAEASPAGVRGRLLDFRRCERGLHPYSFDQLERSIIRHGETGDTGLDAAARKRLDALAAYVRVDTSVRHLFVDGHTDSVGKLANNMRLSRERAEAVAGYLQRLGVPADMLTVRYHADRYPVASNDAAAGRARNRRTTVRLSRAAPPPPVVERAPPTKADSPAAPVVAAGPSAAAAQSADATPGVAPGSTASDVVK